MTGPLLEWIFDFGTQRLIVIIIASFGIGMLAGIWLRHARKAKAKLMGGKGDEAFFKGIQYIISNDHDHAIEEFTKSVQINSDTVETYMALGNLYRSKGEIDRAIRIRQNIILRPNINEQLKLRALLDLGLDYRKGGFLNRALRTFLAPEAIPQVPI